MNKLIKKILALINLIFAFLLLFWCLIILLHGFYNIKVFFPFGFIILLTINLVFLILWIFVNWKYSLISLLPILLSIKYLIMIIPSGMLQKNDNSKSEFQILSYNVRHFGINIENVEESNKIRKNIITNISTANSDIICLQEAYWNSKNERFPTIQKIKKRLNIKYQYLFPVVKLNGGQNYGFVTLSKYPIINNYSYHFYKSFNGFTYSDIVLDNDTIRVYNCHLQSMNFQNKDYSEIQNVIETAGKQGSKDLFLKYLQSAKKRAFQVDTLIATVDTSSYPVFLCGDFNDFPLSLTYLKIRQKFEDSYVSKGIFPGYTWSYSKLKLRIDYIFYDNNDYNCIKYNLLRNKFSDHYGQIAGFNKI